MPPEWPAWAAVIAVAKQSAKHYRWPMNSSLPLANSLHRATLDALRRQAPFAAMGEDEVLWLVQRLSVAYFSRE
ncbi:MAG TPA: hypothetical protein VLA45_08610, partial [Paracoccaceae bacterium]|nr:hypothetical protein [Paracoccaceae bacterium]